ncbi:isoleucine--tRNA ligase [Candidatus Woesearchaeota archaeon ex4484_78]|nr:MAG: isoleucine--tRNA ligase [Candidatus Woesearchaeota archaeon ex4484_78]
MTYDAKTVEPAILKFWEDKTIYEKAVKKNQGKKRFYYLDGPPYTTGKIHIGHAWGKALRDSLLRYKRMSGNNVWDRPGFDMHGLPIEVKVEKSLGIKDKKELVQKLGLRAFIEKCEKYAKSELWPMVKDFKRLGVWLNWKNPYMSIKNEYIEGAWWALAEAHKKGYLYLGKKSMTWCPRCATALAKHELEYETIKEDSVFVKFKVNGKENEYLVVWTTTPWTIPFNLAVMAHPDFEYVKAKIKDSGEIWILAEALASGVIGAVAGKQYEIIEKFKGEKLKGLKYENPFKELPFNKEAEKLEHAYSVIMSDKYVSLDAGSGLVHTAPGCGPEDFEVGKEHSLPPYNELDEHGVFSEKMGEFAGLQAKKDDKKFIEALKKKGLLIAVTPVEHEYAHCWRCKSPVVFRATDQWFLATEKLRDKMIEENKKVHWTPDWAGNKWFDSWLRSLQDWCISRQRFWGIPLPIWKSKSGEIKVIGTKKELEEQSGKKIENLHRPWVDEIKLKSSKGEEMTRVPDVLDVWLDSGVSPWASLDFPADKKLFEELGFPDFILEGKDQIRGWFNSLMCMSMISFEKVPYKAVYMHGFINDAQGRKMSKSLKNIISPYEVIDNYGADTLRYYSIGAANPGLDMNYNHDDAKLKLRNLMVLWNLHKLIIELSKETECNPSKLDSNIMKPLMDLEEKFMFSKLNSTIKKATELFESYKLNEVPWAVEDLFLTLSRTYVQITRDKVGFGSDEEKKTVLYTLYNVFKENLKIFAPIAPFITEQLWQNMRREFGEDEESVHLCDWPEFDEKKIDLELEQTFNFVQGIIQAILSAREKAKLSVRWPIALAEVEVGEETDLEGVKSLKHIIQAQTNCKKINIQTKFPEVKEKLRIETAEIGKAFKKKAPEIIKELEKLDKNKIIDALKAENRFILNIGKERYDLTKEQLVIEREVPKQFVEAEFRGGIVYLDTTRTSDLEAEGFARETMRRVQDLRKKQGLKKQDKIDLYLQVDEDLKEKLDEWLGNIKTKCGAEECKLSEELPAKKYKAQSEEKIKNKIIRIFFNKQ